MTLERDWSLELQRMLESLSTRQQNEYNRLTLDQKITYLKGIYFLKKHLCSIFHLVFLSLILLKIGCLWRYLDHNSCIITINETYNTYKILLKALFVEIITKIIKMGFIRNGNIII